MVDRLANKSAETVWTALNQEEKKNKPHTDNTQKTQQPTTIH